MRLPLWDVIKKVDGDSTTEQYALVGSVEVADGATIDGALIPLPPSPVESGLRDWTEERLGMKLGSEVVITDIAFAPTQEGHRGPRRLAVSIVKVGSVRGFFPPGLRG